MTKKQTGHQDFSSLNKSLLTNVRSREPVRVVRKLGATMFRYDGLYTVDDAYDLLGRSGYRICRYELNQVVSTSDPSVEERRAPIARITSFTSRVVRDTAQSRLVKTLHGYCCQICGVRLGTKNGDYSEGAHVRPLGHPHDGPDEASNILCLCPNHHVQLDRGGLYIADDLKVYDTDGVCAGDLRVVDTHVINREHFAYLRQHFGY